MIGRGFCREMRRGEEAEVRALLEACFDGPGESRLVEALRKGRMIAGEMVLPDDDGIIGYYALSWLQKPKGWLCLAPVAVRPDLQGQGLGRRMIGQLSEWARLSKTNVVVLGEVGFYERAGFSAARAAGLSGPYPIEHTLLAGPGEDVPVQGLVYPRPFETL